MGTAEKKAEKPLGEEATFVLGELLKRHEWIEPPTAAELKEQLQGGCGDEAFCVVFVPRLGIQITQCRGVDMDKMVPWSAASRFYREHFDKKAAALNGATPAAEIVIREIATRLGIDKPLHADELYLKTLGKAHGNAAAAWLTVADGIMVTRVGDDRTEFKIKWPEAAEVLKRVLGTKSDTSEKKETTLPKKDAGMAKSKSTKKRETDPGTLQTLVDQYEQVFGELTHFIDLIASQEEEISGKQTVVYKAKEAYEKAKEELDEAREARDGTKHSLYMFLKPGPAKILPLFDRMEEADEEKHGAHADEWRKEPIAAMRLSLVATNLLAAKDVLFVGQLQDRVQADGEAWFKEIDGITPPMAAAIVDKLNDFITDRTGK